MSMIENDEASASAHAAPDRHSFRRIATASLIGTLTEGYDFVLYSVAAALVFPKVFFPSLGPAGGIVASLATLGIAFVARPIGAVLFGHLGDRLGRKRMLVVTILVMGLGTTLMGLIPSATTIGVAAPILVVVLRFAQGLAIGGEWAGAVLFATEHAPPNRRGLYSTFPQIGHSLPVGLTAASLLVVSLAVSPETFLDWGWRIPFLASAVLLAIGLVVRAKVAETPVFESEQRRSGTPAAPIREAFTAQPGAILRGAGVPLVTIMFVYVANAYLASYGAEQLHISRNSVLGATAVAGVVYAVFTVISGVASDRVGRKRMIVGAQSIALVWSLVLFPVLNTGSTAAFYLALSITFGIAGLAYGAVGAFLPEQFPTRYRYSAAGIAYQIGGIVGGGIAPLVAPIVIGSAGPLTFGVVLAVLCAIAIGCTVSLRENRDRSPDWASGTV